MAVGKLVDPTLQSNLKSALAKHLDKSDTAHDLAHADRVWVNAQAIAQKEKSADLIILIAAAYLHDLVSLPKDHAERKNSSNRSAKAAKPILGGLGYSSSQIEAVQHAIIAHSFSANIKPETIEAKILQDADRLDALGAIGIARTFAVSGAMGRPIYQPDDPFAQNRSLNDAQYAIDHWPQKLLRLPAMMQTCGGKTIAEKRVKIMNGFLMQLAEELGVELPQDLIKFTRV